MIRDDSLNFLRHENEDLRRMLYESRVCIACAHDRVVQALKYRPQGFEAANPSVNYWLESVFSVLAKAEKGLCSDAERASEGQVS